MARGALFSVGGQGFPGPWRTERAGAVGRRTRPAGPWARPRQTRGERRRARGEQAVRCVANGVGSAGVASGLGMGLGLGLGFWSEDGVLVAGMGSGSWA